MDHICIKLCQLADDMTLFLRDNSSVYEAIQVFEEFYRYAGLKLNKSKTTKTLHILMGQPYHSNSYF